MWHFVFFEQRYFNHTCRSLWGSHFYSAFNFQLLHINEIMQCLSLWAWIASLTIKPSRFMHAVTNGILCWGSVEGVLLCMHPAHFLCLFIYCGTPRLIWVIVASATSNMGMHTPLRFIEFSRSDHGKPNINSKWTQNFNQKTSGRKQMRKVIAGWYEWWLDFIPDTRAVKVKTGKRHYLKLGLLYAATETWTKGMKRKI